MTLKERTLKTAKAAYHVPTQMRTGRKLRRPTEPLQLHLGCGHRRLDGFINIDMKVTRATDYVTDVASLPCPDGSVERIEAYHVVEHIPHPLVPDILREWVRALAPGGVMVLECPEIDETVRRYLEGDLRMLATMYGWQRYDGDTHFYGYNVPRLTQLMLDAGLADVVSEEPTDYHAAEEPCLRLVGTKG